MRRVLNDLQSRARATGNDKNLDQQAFEDILDTAGALAEMLARKQDLLDCAELARERPNGADWHDHSGKAVHVLRTVDDIKNHYTARSRETGGSDHEQISTADFLRGVAGMGTTTAVRNALSVGTDSQGGYSVPSLVMRDILSALVPASALLSAGAGIVPLEDGAKSFTYAAVNAIPAAAWRNEGAAVAESDPSFRAVTITPRSLSFLFKVSRELLADSSNLPAALNIAIAAAFAKELDRAGLRGSGSAPEPRGILNVSGVQALTNGAAGTAQATLKWNNLLDATKAILAADGPMPTAAIMSPRSLVGFAALADSTGQPLQKPDLLKDMRFIATSQIPNNLTVTTSTDCTEIYIADYSNLVFGMREQMSVQLLSELYAGTGQIGFVAHCRADVACLHPSAFAVATGIRA